MPKVQAWERLNDPEYSGRLKMEEYYELVLQAGYSAKLAQELARKRGWDRMAAGLPT